MLSGRHSLPKSEKLELTQAPIYNDPLLNCRDTYSSGLGISLSHLLGFWFLTSGWFFCFFFFSLVYRYFSFACFEFQSLVGRIYILGTLATTNWRKEKKKRKDTEEAKFRYQLVYNLIINHYQFWHWVDWTGLKLVQAQPISGQHSCPDPTYSLIVDSRAAHFGKFQSGSDLSRGGEPIYLLGQK